MFSTAVNEKRAFELDDDLYAEYVEQLLTELHQNPDDDLQKFLDDAEERKLEMDINEYYEWWTSFLKRSLAALFLKKYDPPLLVFFWGVLDMKYTVALLKKSETSILFDANPILRAVTAHAQISKKTFLLKWLMMSNHTRTRLTTLLLHDILSHLFFHTVWVTLIRIDPVWIHFRTAGLRKVLQAMSKITILDWFR